MSYQFTAARRAALAKARLISAERRKRNAKLYRGRPSGLSGLKRATVPYARVSKRSSTVGVNAGTIVPGTSKRIVLGGYVRVETIRKQTALDRAASKGLSKLAPAGTKRGRTLGVLRENVNVKNPALRKSVGGAQVRLGTSRMAGPTVVIRRGKHKTPQPKSKAGVQKYDMRMKQISGKKLAKKKARPQRRKARRG